MTNHLEITQSSEEDKNWVDKKLTAFNQQKVPFTQDQVEFLNYHIRNDNNEMIAAINTTMYAWGVLFVELIYVEDAYRKQALGSKLLKHAENEAKKKGAYLVHLDTFDFQAKEFYIKHGFQVFGILENCPPGHSRIYLKKELDTTEVSRKQINLEAHNGNN